MIALLILPVSGCIQPEPLEPDEPMVQVNEQTPEQTPENVINPEAESVRLSIVCTIFPQYDWVREILGENINNMDLTLLIASSVDLHNFQPSVSDIAVIATADIFIYVGGVSDDWVEAVLRQAINPNMITINLLEVLGDEAKFEEIIEGMQHGDFCTLDDCDDPEHIHNHDHDHGHNHDDDHGHDHGHIDHKHNDENHSHDHDHNSDDHGHLYGEMDEHVWLSLRNAVLFCHEIIDALSALDPVNAQIYTENLASYINKLLALDAKYIETLSSTNTKTLLFADRFPFRYLADDYDLHYYAAFTGCSAETEASFITIIFLAGKLDELGLNKVMITESGNTAIAETVINNSNDKNRQILILDSMQSVTAIDVQNGATYLTIMESNLEVLKEALV
jgi:zinc transport system substrate-binding protein